MNEPRRGEPGTWRQLGLWNGPELLDLDDTRAALPANDLDAARLIVTELRPGELHHVPGGGPAGTWYIWNGRCHRPDDSAAIERVTGWFADQMAAMLDYCRGVVAAEVRAANQGRTEQQILAAVKARWESEWVKAGPAGYAAGLRKTAGSAALIKRLAGECGTPPEAMADRWADYLNIRSGILGLLEDGEPRDHDPAAMMTYCLDAAYDPGADCPQYRELLWRASGWDREVYEYLIMVLGYALLGRNPLQLAFFLSGPTASGKSTLLEILSTVLTPRLAYDASPALISAPKGYATRHARHEASLRGKRLVTLSETNDQISVDENQLKRLTGGRKFTVELLYQVETTAADVTWLIIVANNEMPRVAHLDAALRRRIWVIPMGETIPEEQRDGALHDRIVATESAGILNLLRHGCRAAMANGGAALLSPPAIIVAKTDSYAREQDTVLMWRSEATVPANGRAQLVKGSDALADYRTWCGGPEERFALGRTQFYDALASLDGVVRSGDQQHAYFHGFQLKNPPLE